MVHDKVLGIIGTVGHHDRHPIAFEQFESRSHGQAKATRIRGGAAMDVGVRFTGLLDQPTGRVLASIIDHQNFVLDRFALHDFNHAFDRLHDRTFFITGRDHHGEPHPSTFPTRSRSD